MSQLMLKYSPIIDRQPPGGYIQYARAAISLRFQWSISYNLGIAWSDILTRMSFCSMSLEAIKVDFVKLYFATIMTGYDINVGISVTTTVIA